LIIFEIIDCGSSISYDYGLRHSIVDGPLEYTMEDVRTSLRQFGQSRTRTARDCALSRETQCASAPVQHSARGRAKFHMSLLPVIDPGVIKQHRIAVNFENKARHVSTVLGAAT